MVLDGRPIVAQCCNPRGQIFVVGNDRAAVAEGAKILARVETESCGVAEATYTPFVVTGTVCLRGVLQHSKAPFRRDFHDRRHVGG